MKRILCMVLITFMSLALFAACGGESGDGEPNAPGGQNEPAGNNDNNGNNNNDNNGDGEITSAEPDMSMLDELGEFDFDGYEFKMYSESSTYFNAQLNVEEQSAEIVEDAIYRRNRIIEDRFNFRFVETLSEGIVDINFLRRIVQSGSNDYDIMTTAMKRQYPMAQGGLIHPAGLLPHIDTSKGYWDSKLMNDLAIIGKQYFVVGSYDLSAYDFTHILLFNKSMLADLALDDPYKLVKEGNWTFEAYNQMARDAHRDVNGDGNYGPEDQYGLLARSNQIVPSFYIGGGTTAVVKDSDGVPRSNLADEHFVNVFGRVFDITRESWFITGTDQSVVDAMFMNNQGLFLQTSFFFAKPLRAMETDFGILPYPKFDANQKDYLTRLASLAVATIPVSADEEMLARTSVILEALACESSKIVIPALYDVALKVRDTRDEESSDMLDIIFANRVFDIGDAVWDAEVRNVFQGMYEKDDRNIVSRAESLSGVIGKLSDAMTAAFEELA